MDIRIGKLGTTQLVAAFVVCTAALAAGCDQRPAAETVGQKVDRSVNRAADATDRAANRVASAADDTAITAKVKAAVLAEPGLKSLQIDVDTHDAVVTLSGTVDNGALKARATQIAQNVEGVRSVVDNLEVKAG